MNDRSRQVDVLQQLSPTELDTLQLRCQGRTTAEIAQAQFVSEVEARNTLGHLYDALWLTHLPRERRIEELRRWSDLLRAAREQQLFADRFRGYVPQPAVGAPPAAALAAVAADDEVITRWDQPPVAASLPATSRRRGLPPWWPGVVVVVALLLAGGLAFLALGDDDDDERPQAVVPTIPVSPSATTDDSASVATTTSTTAPATEASETSTEIVPSETASPASTDTPRMTATTTARATATATSPAPTATPAIAYEADWSQDLNSWTGDEGWRVENGMLVFDGQGGSRTIWSPIGVPSGGDYAVEAEILVNNGAYTSAVAGFALRDASDQSNPDGQVATVVSTGNWHTYRLEVRDGAALFSVDGTLVGDFDDARLASPDQLGIFAVATRVEVRAFRIVPL